MKKLFMSALLSFLSATLFAQKISPEKVPGVVRESLKKTHPQAAAKWEWEGADYEANFKEGGREVSCILSREGKIKETEIQLPPAALPKAARDYIAKNFRGKKIAETSRIVAADGTTTYEVVTGAKENIFDAAGNFKEQKTEKE